MALYPLSAFRAMSAAALEVFEAIRREGTQKSVLGKMQSRADLYEVLNYNACETKLDELFSNGKKS
jgi:methylisocitrate lyase